MSNVFADDERMSASCYAVVSHLPLGPHVAIFERQLSNIQYRPGVLDVLEVIDSDAYLTLKHCSRTDWSALGRIHT